jgi:hypothetical protein
MIAYTKGFVGHRRFLILFYLCRVFNAAAQRQARDAEGDLFVFSLL